MLGVSHSRLSDSRKLPPPPRPPPLPVSVGWETKKSENLCRLVETLNPAVSNRNPTRGFLLDDRYLSCLQIEVIRSMGDSPFENLIASPLVKKIPAFYGTRLFITVFRRAHHLSISWASSQINLIFTLYALSARLKVEPLQIFLCVLYTTLLSVKDLNYI
jgi:hypothetical protein